MKIYGHFFSPPANQVRLTASALGIKHDYEHVDLMQGQHKTPEYLAINPFGRVPALDDNGFTLAESGAISRYLACKTNCDMYPEDGQKRAEIDQWMDVAAHHVRANMAKILFNKVIAPMIKEPVDEKSMAQGHEFLTNAMPGVDAGLERNPYLAGNTMTLADTAMIAAMEPFEMIGYDISAFSNVVKWRENNMAQAWYQDVHKNYGAEMQ